MLINIITNLTGSTPQPSVSSLLTTLLYETNLSTTNLSTLLSQFSGSNALGMNIQSVISSLIQSNESSFNITQMINLLNGLLSSNNNKLDVEALSKLANDFR